MWKTQVQSLGREDPLEKKLEPTPVFLPEESHGQRSLEGYSPQGRKDLQTTEQAQTRYSIAYMYPVFFIHSSANGHRGCFHVLAVVNSIALNIGVHVSFSILVSLGYMSSSGIAGSYGGFIPSF